MGSRRLQGLQKSRDMCCPVIDTIEYRAGCNILLKCGLHKGPPYTFLQSCIGLFSPQVANKYTIMYLI